MTDNECDCWYDIVLLKEHIERLQKEIDTVDYELYDAKRNINALWEAIDVIRQDD